MEIQETKEFAKQWIEEGRLCKRIHGLAYRGARHRVMTKEEALDLLPLYRFGMGYKELSFVKKYDGEVFLEFASYSENDLY